MPVPIYELDSTPLAGIPGETTDFGFLSVVAPAEAAPVSGRLHDWTLVKGLATAVAANGGDCLEITVSAEIYQAGGMVSFRALVDGQVAEPSDVQFKAGDVNFDGVRSFTFVQENVKAGQHLVEIQSRSGSPFQVRDRILSVYTGNPSQGSSGLTVARPPSGPPITATSQYQDIPGLKTGVTTNGPCTLAIVFSAEAWADSGRLMVRAVVNGSPVGEVIFAEAGDAERGGTHSFTFIMPALKAGLFSEVKMQWRASGGVSRMGDRTMSAAAIHPGSQQVLAKNPASPVALTATQWKDFAAETTTTTTATLSNVVISASTEVLSNKGRVFMRVLVDGEPALPRDVTLIQGGSKWRATSHTFVVKNVAPGRHKVRVQVKVDRKTTAKLRRRTVRILSKQRRGQDFVQPFLRMTPLVRSYRLLVIGFDPVRPDHPRPSFAQIRNTFEGNPDLEVGATTEFDVGKPGPNLRDWLKENSGGLVTIYEVSYVGCHDDAWYVAPPERQGNWYWDNNAFDQMWKDALTAADVDVDFHAFDTDQDNRLNRDELVVAIVRPQVTAFGTLRGTSAFLDGSPVKLGVPVLDIYLSFSSLQLKAGVGIVAHELSHHIFGAHDLYGSCAEISSSLYSIMDDPYEATHLDPFEKMKSGLVQPWTVDLNSDLPVTWVMQPVEIKPQILLVYDPARVAREYFLIEYRFGDRISRPNYDAPLRADGVVIWQIFEDLQLVHTSAVCQGDPRYIRKRAVLSFPQKSYDLEWADGTPTGCRVSTPVIAGGIAHVRLEKFSVEIDPEG